jgi:hypothetical protein
MPARFVAAPEATAYMCGSVAADWMTNQRFVDSKEGSEGHGRIAGR